jgi:hypothetical protein
MEIVNVILLENENILFFTSENMYDYLIMKESIDKTDFAKKNTPLIILEKIQITDINEIETHVKKYMQYYGIDNVVGGSYTATTKAQSEELQREFANSETIELLNSLKYYVHNRKTYTIDRNLITEIQWLSDTIKLKSTITLYTKNYPQIIIEQLLFDNSIYDRYKELILVLSSLHKKTNFAKTKYEHFDHLVNPDRIFDKFIHATQTIDQNDIEIASKLCDYFEYLSYCIINKCDELEFDINHCTIQDTGILDEDDLLCEFVPVM